MALSGTFLADFSSFYDAVEKADVSLKGMETGAGNVEKAMNRVADSFSGRKIVQDATIAVEAIERIGGVTKLTEAETLRPIWRRATRPPSSRSTRRGSSLRKSGA
jgi:hypothetical protein